MITRTINQIHFEDLDPIRFEEMILAIVYRWKRWETLDHLGKKGSDNGIDIRGTEILDDGKRKTYIFQCKRYSKITKKQLTNIIDDYFNKNSEVPDAYVLAIGCPISKTNIDVFREYAIRRGIKQVIIWTSSILETMLYSDYQDLLFAFFGMNLTEERNNKIKRIRRSVALKKKMHNDFLTKGGSKDSNEVWEKIKKPWLKFCSTELLIHSISDMDYPENTLLENDYTGYFKVEPYNFYFNGLIVIFGVTKLEITSGKETDEIKRTEGKALKLGYIPFENIIDYDIDGDEYYSYPHLYCYFINVQDPFEKIGYSLILEDDDYMIIENNEDIEIREIKGA